MILLDRNADADIPDGYHVVTTERAFLAVAGIEPRILVRGAVLCDWAAEFYTGRRLDVQETESPSSFLKTLCPELTPEQVDALVTRVRPRLYELHRPWRLSSLLQLLYPNALWEETPSKVHAAEWLLWLHQNDPSPADAPLRHALAQQWQQRSDPAIAAFYRVEDRATATATLLAWLDVTDENPYAYLRPFPGTIPQSVISAAKERWKKVLIQSRGEAVSKILARPLHPQLRSAFVTVAYEYLVSHPSHLTETIFNRLAPRLTTTQQTKLRGLLPPSPLPDLPETPVEMLSWFRDRYIPYRLWQINYGDEAATAQVRTALRAFASWYLEKYRDALAGGVLAPYLSFNRSAALQQSGDQSITLVVVLDGLQWVDAQQLLRALDAATSRLTVVSLEMAFAPLPTVTKFCKESLFRGVPPVHIPNANLLGQIESDLAFPVQRLHSARPGDLIYWRIMEPDATYHDRNSAVKLSHEIEAVLDAVAAKLAEVVETLPPQHNLRVLITTDHGRLLGRSERILPVPTQMESHGRAAWGYADRDFSPAGYMLEQELAYLHRAAFGLPSDAAVIVSEQSFRTTDGKTGAEVQPHGGLSPEEVIIPWLVALRDFTRPELEVQLTGSGRAEATGQLEVSITNLGSITVVCTSVVLSTSHARTISVGLDLECPPNEQTSISITLEGWPTPKAIEALQALAHFVLPNRQEYSLPVASVTLRSEEMYTRTDILEGLDL